MRLVSPSCGRIIGQLHPRDVEAYRTTGYNVVPSSFVHHCDGYADSIAALFANHEKYGDITRDIRLE